jgi:hypothetical protein
MNDGPKKLHTGYLVEDLELFIRKVAYTKYDATILVRWSNWLPLDTLPLFRPAWSTCFCSRLFCSIVEVRLTEQSRSTPHHIIPHSRKGKDRLGYIG